MAQEAPRWRSYRECLFGTPRSAGRRVEVICACLIPGAGRLRGVYTTRFVRLHWVNLKSSLQYSMYEQICIYAMIRLYEVVINW